MDMSTAIALASMALGVPPRRAMVAASPSFRSGPTMILHTLIDGIDAVVVLLMTAAWRVAGGGVLLAGGGLLLLLGAVALAVRRRGRKGFDRPGPG